MEREYLMVVSRGREVKQADSEVIVWAEIHIPSIVIPTCTPSQVSVHAVSGQKLNSFRGLIQDLPRRVPVKLSSFDDKGEAASDTGPVKEGPGEG